MEMIGERHTQAALPPAKNRYVGSTKVLDVLEKRIIPRPCRESRCRPLSPWPSHYTDYTLQLLDTGRHDIFLVAFLSFSRWIFPPPNIRIKN